MKKTWGRIPGLSTGCGVFLILEDDMLVVRARFSEKNGPPRIGRVTLDSNKFYTFTDFTPSNALK